MILTSLMRIPTRTVRSRVPLVLLAVISTACATTPHGDSVDTAETILAVPASEVRDAVVEILIRDGYEVAVTRAQSIAVTTGYREELESPWDWLLRTRFGVGRNQAEARITELVDATSKLSIQVHHESKAGMWGSWEPSEPPRAQSAQNYLRLIRNYLRVL